MFASVGDGLAVASSSSLQLLNESGELVFKQVVSYDSPAVFGSANGAVFCDLGGKQSVFAAPDGESTAIQPGGEILTAGMNENGWFYLVTAEAGYKALVELIRTGVQQRQKRRQRKRPARRVLLSAVRIQFRELPDAQCQQQAEHGKFGKMSQLPENCMQSTDHCLFLCCGALFPVRDE